MSRTTPHVAVIRPIILPTVRVSRRKSRAKTMVKIGEQMAISVRFKAGNVRAAMYTEYTHSHTHEHRESKVYRNVCAFRVILRANDG